MTQETKEEINLKKVKEVYQELYNSDNPSFFREGVPYYIVIGIKGKSFEEDLAINITRDNIEKFTCNKFLQLYILDKDEDSFFKFLDIRNIIEVDPILRQKLKKTFNDIKGVIIGGEYEIISEPINLGSDWKKKGQPILERKVSLDDSMLKYLMFVSINSPEENYNNVKQYMAHFKIQSRIKQNSEIIIKEERSKDKEERSKEEFKPIETIIDYEADKNIIMKIPAVKRRIEERKKWLPYSDEDLFYLIFAPIRFLRFKHMQNRLIKNYIENGKAKPPIVSDIKENALLDGVWEYKDIEYLVQIDMLVENGIIVPTDFNFCSPPYSVIYKAIKDGVLMVGGIEHHFECTKEEEIIKNGIKEKIRKPGHFITYTCMKKMGSEGTQVLIKYQNEIGTTNRMITCKEMDLEMVGEKLEEMKRPKMDREKNDLKK